MIAGGGSETVLIIAGFAAAITESISMGAVGYTSSISERDSYLAQRAHEEAEIAATPDEERQEIRDIYAAKGFTGPLLENVVSTITANRETGGRVACAWSSSVSGQRPSGLPSGACSTWGG